jgi:hypothetical protein
MIIKKMVMRAKIARNMSGNIIPAVTNHLNAKTKTIKDHEVLICGARIVEVTVKQIQTCIKFRIKDM